MACKPVCRLCSKFIISQDVSFTGGNLVVNIPAGSYANNEKYCIVLSQNIPDTTTINAPVVISVGTGTELYPVVTKCCRPVLAAGIRTRTRYSMVVETSATGANFKLLGNTCPCPTNVLRAVDGTAPTATTPTTPTETT